MTVAAARQLRNGTVCFVGIGLPSEAANLARALHAPKCVLIYESGLSAPGPPSCPPVDHRRRGAGRHRRRRRLPGGCPDRPVRQPQHHHHRPLRAAEGPPPRVRGRPRDRLVGERGDRGAAPQPARVRRAPGLRVLRRLPVGKGAREQLGLLGAGPTVVITDLGVSPPAPDARELTLASVHPAGVSTTPARPPAGSCAWPTSSSRPSHPPGRSWPPSARSRGRCRGGG
jgi:glutaconate CoA-transferase subunit B